MSARKVAVLVLAIAVPLFKATVSAADEDQRLQSPRWMFELKFGQFEPDLDEYEDFYGDDRTDYGAFAFAYRRNHWLEFGGELGYSSDRGVGLLPENEEPGGSVKYRLMPLQAFANVRGDFKEDQLFVPYAGVGLAMAFYKQEIEDQSDRRGNTDLGYSLRAGVALSFNRLDPTTVAAAKGNRLKKTFGFFEIQQWSAEKDGTDLGGLIYMLGLRFEYDFRSDEERAPR